MTVDIVDYRYTIRTTKITSLITTKKPKGVYNGMSDLYENALSVGRPVTAYYHNTVPIASLEETIMVFDITQLWLQCPQAHDA